MRKNIAEALIFLSGIALIAYILIYKDTTQPFPALLIAIAVNIITTPLYVGIVEGIYSIRKLPLIFKTQVWYRKKDVRLSISYLFRIKSNGKYLLVKNRKGNYYQLVGGAYKTLPGAEKVFKENSIKPDKRFETEHGIAKNDLRFRLPGRNVMKIIRWFNSREDREISQWREFCEELLTTNIITDKHSFRYIDYKYVTTVQTPIQKAKNLSCQEILIYEIFDLIPNDEQIKVLDELYQNGDTDRVKWADETLINSLGFDERKKEMEYEIGAHTKWAVNEKYSTE
ncbi:hypothetical protein QWZ08_00355 [Ferruginibacter paludis]|uniref:SMODS-associated NUDIX domain-containing protein n=1 Tax=Ferruginibacter paludis TaxID=1310417 RepID=UPI0025B52915|nr:hypothetical protein [Ferruginibacter paludis]MDN3654052.1 hypothetical protein [Ferruginibacter paludis]